MLDIDVCIDALRGQSLSVRTRLERMSPEEAAVSSIVAAELWTGFWKSTRPAESRSAIDAFLEYLSVLDWPAEAAATYGEVRARLERSGGTIGAMDLLIAVPAIHEGATLITRNVSEFRRVSGLKVERW